MVLLVYLTVSARLLLLVWAPRVGGPEVHCVRKRQAKLQLALTVALAPALGAWAFAYYTPAAGGLETLSAAATAAVASIAALLELWAIIHARRKHRSPMGIDGEN